MPDRAACTEQPLKTWTRLEQWEMRNSDLVCRVGGDFQTLGRSGRKEDRFEKQRRNKLWTLAIEGTSAVTQVKNGAFRRRVICLDCELVWEGGGDVQWVTGGFWLVKLEMPGDHPTGKVITRQ